MTESKILHTLAGGPLTFEALGLGKSGTAYWHVQISERVICSLTPTQQFSSYAIARTSYFSMR